MRSLGSTGSKLFPMACLAIASALILAQPAAAMSHEHTSGKFSGAKVNDGTVKHTKEGTKNVLTLSDDFKDPGTPDPHWQVVDSKGNTYMLHKLSLKDGKMNKQITLPDYIHDVAKVQIWCAWAESLLGEASFSSPVK